MHFRHLPRRPHMCVYWSGRGCVCVARSCWCVFVSYLVLWVGVGDFERGHGCRHGFHGCEDVLKDAFGEGLPLLLGEASAVDDPHLSEEGGFTTFPSAWRVKWERLGSPMLPSG